MRLELTRRQARLLLDMVYIGNWILNSTRGEDRITEYDEIESHVLSHCREQGMQSLAERFEGEYLPSRAYVEGGVHEAIADYEDTVFFEILAEELARRDIALEDGDEDDIEELNERISAYISEFERNGTDNISINM